MTRPVTHPPRGRRPAGRLRGLAGDLRGDAAEVLSTAAHRRWAAALLLATAASVSLAALQAVGQPILGLRWVLLVLLAVWGAVWLLSLICVSRLPDRRAVTAAILVAGIAIRLASMGGPATLSDDLYRYSWDAQAQLHGIDPYRYAPDAAALRGLRGSWLWPGPARCAQLDRAAGCTRINRPAVRTIYPPVAEAWFTSVYAIGGGMGARYKLWQGAGLITEVAVMALLARLLARRGRDGRWLALYALCPLPAVEIVNNGHVDGLGVALLLGALLVLGPRAPTRLPWRSWAAGALVGGAALVKLYPAIMLLPLWAAPGVTRRDRLRMTAACAAVVVAGYAPHVAAVGLKVLGYLPGYLKEEHYTGQASRFLLVDLLRLPPKGSDVVIALVVAATAGWILRRRPDPAAGSVALMGVLLLCATPVQPWYGITLLALAAAAGRPHWAWIVVAGYPYFFAVILAAKHVVGIGELSYGAAAALVAAAAWAWRQRGTAPGSGRPGVASRTPRPVGAPP